MRWKEVADACPSLQSCAGRMSRPFSCQIAPDGRARRTLMDQKERFESEMANARRELDQKHAFERG